MKTGKQKGSTPPVTLSASKKRIFILTTATIPVILFLLLEITLRLFHYGPDISLFTTEQIAGKTYYRMNPDVKSRYFTSIPFNPSTSPDLFQMPKPHGTFRIFCLGGSTTVGYPYWCNGSFSTFLRDRLRAIFPEKQIEVINVGMTATNSFTVNDMARDLVDYQPDLFLVYDGHNEFYGALGVASHESLGRMRVLTKTYLRLIHLKTFMLIRDGLANLGGLFAKPSVSGSTMMEKLAHGQYIPFNSETYQAGLKIFKANLEEIKSISQDHSVPVLISSQVSNLRDLSPFISVNPDEKRNRDSATVLYDAGIARWEKGKPAEALQTFRQAAEHDSTRANIHYMIAKCLDTLGRKSAARSEYIKARDFDQLRFRTSSDFNNAISSVCNGDNMMFVDIEHAFQNQSPDSLIGHNLIVEHLHPNSSGFFLMAKEYARVLRERGLIAPAKEWKEKDTIRDEVFWERRSVTEIDELVAKRRTEILTAGWPFTNHIPVVTAVAAGDTLGGIVEEMTRGRMDWQQAHLLTVEYYASRGETDKVEKEYRLLINQIPYEITPYLKLARILLDKNEITEVRKLLLSSLELAKTILAYRALGDIALREGKPQEAISWYEGMSVFNQAPREQIENGYLLSVAYAEAGKLDKASMELLKVLQLKPDYQPAAALLAKIKAKK